MNLINTVGTQRLPLVPGSIMFANNISNYFIDKIENIRKKLDAIPGLSSGSDKSPENISTMTEFNILTEEDVITFIKNSSLKSCPLDPMPWRLVSECSSLLPVLTKIINSSLQNGHFPKTWKDAMVFPLLKKIGVDFALDNLRPVRNLKFVSKLTEMAACNQVHSHVSANNLYTSLQSSYRKGHSTETALLKIVNDILLNMNKQHVTLLVLLDLSAAFDTVDHDILIQRLTTKFGINGVVFNWFKSYLEKRSQHVSVQGSVSEMFDLKWGVPQGSCLGPLLFMLYASELFNLLEAHLLSVHCYAHDIQLYLSCCPNDNHGEDDPLKAMELCVQDIRVWLSRDKLFMNDKKTEFLVIGTRQKLKKFSIDCLTIGTEKMLAAEKLVKNLGVWLDSKLSMDAHIY